LALLYEREGRDRDAESLYQRSLGILEKTLPPEHFGIASILNNLARIYYRGGRYADAEPLYRRSLSILEKVLGPEHPAVAESLSNLADLYQAQGRVAEADELYRQSEAIRRSARSRQDLQRLPMMRGSSTCISPLLRPCAVLGEAHAGTRTSSAS
jgi:tetratricopeptide (TPR) repeat protein